MNEIDILVSINIEESLNYHPEFKLLTNFYYLFYNQNLLEENKINDSYIMQYISENEENFQGEEFTDILNFTIYNYLVHFENKNSNENCLQIFKNLKLYFSMNIIKHELPLFFYNIVYKSLVYLNKMIVDTHKFFKKENNSRILLEILEFIPNLFNQLKLSESKDPLREDAINQIEITCYLLNNVNNFYDNSNKFKIAFYLQKMNPFVNKETNSRKDKNLEEKEKDICLQKNKYQYTFCKEDKTQTLRKNQGQNFNFDSFISNPRINMNNNPNNLNILNNFNQINANVFNNTSSFLTDFSSNYLNNINNNNILNDSFCEDNENLITKEQIYNSNSNYKIKEDILDKKEFSNKNKEILLYSKENLTKNSKKANDENENMVHNKNSISVKKLTSKIKKFTENHFDRQTFRDKVLSLLSIQEKDILSMLEMVGRDLYYEVKNIFNLENSNLEFEKLKQEFSNIFKNYTLHLIGSLSYGVYSNLRERTSIDFVLLPNIKNESDKYFTSMNEFVNLLTNHTDLYDIQFNQEENKEILKDLIATMTIYSKNNKKYFNSIIFVHKEKLIYSNDYFSNIFFHCENLQILHIFLQEILITNIGFCCTRWDLTITILSFLDFHLDFLNKNEKKFVTFNSLISEDPENYQTSKLIENKEVFFYFELDEGKLEELKTIPVGELILEFLRYFLNYMNWFKNNFNKNKCKGFEKLQKIFENNFIRNKNYLFHHEYIDEFFNLSQEAFINEFISRFVKLEEIFFIICENSRNIKRYSDIISNIKQVDADI